MKILILGSGQVGTAVAQNLVEIPNHDVTVIDNDPDALRNIGGKLDVQTLLGNGSSPAVMAEGGAYDTDLLLALTRHDETNLAACKLAASLFNIPNRIARVRLSDYLEYTGREGEDEPVSRGTLDLFDVSESICPEQLVTERLADLLCHPSALQVLTFAEDKVRMLVVRAQSGGRLLGKPIHVIHEHLPEGTNCQICAVYRNNKLIMPTPQTVIQQDDEVFVAAPTSQVAEVLRELRPKQQPTRRVMIAGGGQIGFRLSRQLEQHFDVKIIENNEKRAEWLSENLNSALVLHGSAVDEGLLEGEYIDEIDVFCALTNDDENNIMAGMLAKSLGAKRVIAIVNRSSYVDLLQGNTIDIVVSPHLVTIGSILAHIRRGDVEAVHPLRGGSSEAIEIIAHGDRDTSKLVGRRVRSVRWPSGCHVAAVVRGKEVFMGHQDVELADGDHIILFVARRRVVSELEKLIQVRIGFFG
ncbi:Trk system potassium transport protein TrkA [Eikenella longinqua]|uniref:Trk system potassium uptake protein TrkA n=1 Tax=Eikenella longinqua TaxID=1795827 RepID=A0A1A9RZ18_9NEIS|nr:Trk system potassium transporter TrkA [Eikenella longinqua]OAM29970.1 Trk system potassium transport protein TrkA [Eikenella longinqua]